jgi:hypothetical protein
MKDVTRVRRKRVGHAVFPGTVCAFDGEQVFFRTIVYICSLKSSRRNNTRLIAKKHESSNLSKVSSSNISAHGEEDTWTMTNRFIRSQIALIQARSSSGLISSDRSRFQTLPYELRSRGVSRIVHVPVRIDVRKTEVHYMLSSHGGV